MLRCSWCSTARIRRCLSATSRRALTASHPASRPQRRASCFSYCTLRCENLRWQRHSAVNQCDTSVQALPCGISRRLRTVDEVPDLGAVRPPSSCKGISGWAAHGFLAVGALERQAGVRQALDVRRLHEGHVVSREIWSQVIEDNVPTPDKISANLTKGTDLERQTHETEVHADTKFVQLAGVGTADCAAARAHREAETAERGPRQPLPRQGAR